MGCRTLISLHNLTTLARGSHVVAFSHPDGLQPGNSSSLFRMTNFPRELGDEMESYVEVNESPGESRSSSNNLFRNDVANALRWASIALIGIFIVSVISVILPIQLFRPEWQDKLIGSIRGGASFPLEGVLFMMLASLLSPDDPVIFKNLRRVRKFSAAMSLIFLLMVPLQLYTGYTVIGSRTTGEFKLLALLKNGAYAIDRSASETEFRAALASIPGAPPLPATKLTEPIPLLKSNVLQQINPQIKQLETQIGEQRRKRTELFIGFGIRDVFICLFYALAFGAMAKRTLS